MSDIEERELPEKWEWSTLGEVCEKPQYGWTTKASKEGSLHLLRTTDITAGQINWATVPYCVAEPGDKEKYRIKDGDIVVSRAGSVGVSYLISNPKPSVFASYLIRFKPLINRKYVYYFLKSPDYWNAISEKSSGIALQNVNATKLKEINIPIAPPEQQKQIVAKIEQLFSHIDAGIVALNTAKQRLKQYRQSVLKAAVTGELSKEWREAQQNTIGCAEARSASIPHAEDALPIVSTSYESADKLLERILQTRRQKWEEQQLAQFKAKGKIPKNDKWKEKYKEPAQAKKWNFLSALPESWSWVSVDQIGDSQDQPVLTGPFGSNLGKNDFIEQGIPLLTIGCLKEAGIDLSKAKYISEKKSEELYRYKLKNGDLLFSRMAAVGRVGFVTSELEGALFNYHIMRLRLHPLAMEQEYFVTYVRGSREVYEYVKEVNHGATRDGINTQQLLEMPVALAPFQEQKEICRVVGDKLSVIRRLEQDIDIQLKKAKKTKQSILASAFSGKLI